MSIPPAKQRSNVRWVLLFGTALVVVAACGGRGSGIPSATAGAGSASGSPTASGSPSDGRVAASGPAASSEPDTGTTSGDVPDNAVFLAYRDPKLGFTIDYVEGWQVSGTTDGVAIRDKDSSELVQVVPPQVDIAAYLSGTDLPALGLQAGFKLIKQDSVSVNNQDLVHIVYDVSSPPDPVTGKQVPSVVDRYYVPGPSGLAIVSLATPKGVDNVDAFRQMIESFRWA